MGKRILPPNGEQLENDRVLDQPRGPVQRCVFNAPILTTTVLFCGPTPVASDLEARQFAKLQMSAGPVK